MPYKGGKKYLDEENKKRKSGRDNTTVDEPVLKKKHGVSQKNNMGYARLTLQDYTGSFEFGAYREDYEKYKELLQPGYVLYVEGIFKAGYSSDRFFFKIIDIRLMASLSEDLTKSLTIRIPLDIINQEFITNLKGLCAQHKGKHKLHMQVFDLTEGDDNDHDIDFDAASIKIDVNSNLINEIRQLGLSYKLN